MVFRVLLSEQRSLVNLTIIMLAQKYECICISELHPMSSFYNYMKGGLGSIQCKVAEGPFALEIYDEQTQNESWDKKLF